MNKQEAEVQANRSKVYQGKVFEPGEIVRSLRFLLNEIGVPEAAVSVSSTLKYGEGGELRKEITLSDLEVLSDFDGQTTGINLSYPPNLKRDYDKSNYIGLSSFQSGILLTVVASPPSAVGTIIILIENQLKLIEMPKKEIETFASANLQSRVEIVENKILELTKLFSCFLSYRFTPRGKVLALEMSRFLALLNVKVVSGLGYEPRRVAEKVIERLKSGHDFFIYLITKDGESTWTRDELAVAYGEGVPVIILIEKGAEIGKGLLGDWEYIEFESDHVGDTFIAILEALAYLRDQKTRNLVQQKSPPDA